MNLRGSVQIGVGVLVVLVASGVGHYLLDPERTTRWVGYIFSPESE